MLLAGGAEAALPALRVGQGVDRDDRNLSDGANHQLGDPVAPADKERLAAMVDQDHHQLAAIIRIDGTGRVEQRHAMLDRQA